MSSIGKALLFSAVVAMAGSPALAKGGKAAPAAKKTPAKAPKKSVAVSAEHKKALAELYAGFKFGTSKDEVLAVLQKKIDERYEDMIKQTTDVAKQDRIRKDKKAELARVASTYVEFNGKKTGWDVSIIENEFAHNTGESMMEQWENQGGKNQRRFFFFSDGKLYKMFVSLDVSILPADKKTFDTFRGVMEAKYGPGDVDAGTIQWNAGDFDVRAVDRLKDYDALGLAIEDPHVRMSLEASREAKAGPKKETSPIIKGMVDEGNKDHPDIRSNGGAVDAVIQANGGGGDKK